MFNLSWFLGEMTLNPVTVNLDFNVENGNDLSHVEAPGLAAVKEMAGYVEFST